MTSSEAQAKFVAGEERKLQGLVWNELTRRGIYFNSDRMDKRTSGKKGRADFRCCIPRVSGPGAWLSLECKVGKGQLTKEQIDDATRLRQSGGFFVVVHTLEEAIAAIEKAKIVV
jgi:hypothetical protein